MMHESHVSRVADYLHVVLQTCLAPQSQYWGSRVKEVQRELVAEGRLTKKAINRQGQVSGSSKPARLLWPVDPADEGDERVRKLGAAGQGSTGPGETQIHTDFKPRAVKGSFTYSNNYAGLSIEHERKTSACRMKALAPCILKITHAYQVDRPGMLSNGKDQLLPFSRPPAKLQAGVWPRCNHEC